MRRRVPSAVAAALTLAAAAGVPAACGGGDAPPPPVRVSVTSPRDMEVVRSARVEVRGTVRPVSAVVTVGGHAAAVSEGAWHATVSLTPGTNVIDVLASAGDARPALTAIRVRRRVSVRVPDVTGLPVADARAQLEALGLKTEVDDQDSFLDRFLPGGLKACSTDPAAGEDVDPGTTVTVAASRRC